MSLRLIAGKFKGHVLQTPVGQHTRPTANRVREALFNILGPISGVVLDAFAGSGALGLEALSRGAHHVHFIENAPPALRVLQSNINKLQVAKYCSVWAGSIPQLTLPILTPVDLIFFDPPYAFIANHWQSWLKWLQNIPLAATAQLILEHERSIDLPMVDSPWKCVSQRSYGRTTLSFFLQETS